MSIFDLLTLIGGLCLFLFGMTVMGDALERRAGNNLRTLLRKMTTKKSAGLFTGMGITAVIQSSSATTVMVVGFVNSGLMTLKQAINVIMGANIGTTITAWVLSLGGIDSNNTFVKLLKPTSFTPILAIFGIIFYLFCKGQKKKDNGAILLGFTTLMFGMNIMSDAVSGLADVPQFQELFLLFTNPVLGLLAGAVLTAIIQSSSASVGILQALSATGQVTYGAAIPIIMGQNIGTCITALLSSIGANKNAKRAALVHLSFNIIGSAFWLTVFWLIKRLLSPALLGMPTSLAGIAVTHTAFNILCTLLLLPMAGVLEKLAIRIIPDPKAPEERVILDERLLLTPPLAIAHASDVTAQMAKNAIEGLHQALRALFSLTDQLAESVRESERKSDKYEDILGTYLVKLSTNQTSAEMSTEAAKLLKVIGDFERISDHSVNLLESAEELHGKNLYFTVSALKELKLLTDAVKEISELAYTAFIENDLLLATKAEALEQVIDRIKATLRSRHISRLQKGECAIETGFVWSDILTDLERISDHCANISAGVIEAEHGNLNQHKEIKDLKEHDPKFAEFRTQYAKKYSI